MYNSLDGIIFSLSKNAEMQLFLHVFHVVKLVPHWLGLDSRRNLCDSKGVKFLLFSWPPKKPTELFNLAAESRK